VARPVTLAVAAVAVALVTATAAAAAPRDTLGTYRAAGNPGLVGQFESWLGHPVYRAHDFLADEDWSKVATPYWWVQQWKPSPYRGRMVFSVPLLVQGATLEECATGAYNQHFRSLGNMLVANGMGGSTLRFGWEADGNWYRWQAAGREAAYRQCFRNAAFSARVPGAWFKFDWTITNTSWRTGMDVEAAYPGDDVVDFVGQDVYAQAQQGSTGAQRFRTALTQPYGLAWQLNFAARHGKKLSYPEWGLWGLDDPEFVRLMHAWMTATEPGWHGYWENGAARLTDGSKPAAAAEFLKLY
jgi:hypothetical protein